MRAVTAGAIVLLGLIGVSCGSSVQVEERSPGEVAFSRHCQTCHRLPDPNTKSDEEWPALVSRYGKRARINEETVAIIASYLRASNPD